MDAPARIFQDRANFLKKRSHGQLPQTVVHYLSKATPPFFQSLY